MVKVHEVISLEHAYSQGTPVGRDGTNQETKQMVEIQEIQPPLLLTTSQYLMNAWWCRFLLTTCGEQDCFFPRFIWRVFLLHLIANLGLDHAIKSAFCFFRRSLNDFQSYRSWWHESWCSSKFFVFSGLLHFSTFSILCQCKKQMLTTAPYFVCVCDQDISLITSKTCKNTWKIQATHHG